MLIERRRMFGFSWFERINPYSPSTASGSSGFSRDHTFRSIENLTDALHPLKCRPTSNSSHPLHATKSHRPATWGRHLP